MYRIGHGYDAHCFEAGDFVTLGGVKIPHARGLKAHSDGDLIIHAICDALPGAVSLGDIGQHFPDTDSKYHNQDSRFFLRHVTQLLENKGYRVVNVDVTVLAEAPKLAKFIPQMCEMLAADMSITTESVNVKATTTEKMGFVGREEGLACYAVVLIAK